MMRCGRRMAIHDYRRGERCAHVACYGISGETYNYTKAFKVSSPNMYRADVVYNFESSYYRTIVMQALQPETLETDSLKTDSLILYMHCRHSNDISCDETRYTVLSAPRMLTWYAIIYSNSRMETSRRVVISQYESMRRSNTIVLPYVTLD